MKDNVKFIQMIIRFVGALLIILGIVFWITENGQLIIFHILLGIVLILLLWAQSYFSARGGASKGMVALTVVWGFILPVLGLTQANLLTGSFHWAVHVVHLLVGIIALGDTEVLASQVKNR